MPLYTATVTSLTRGWTYTVAEGDVPNPLIRTHLGDPLTYDWGFAGEVVPAQLEPTEASFRFVCAAMSDVPTVDRGDFVMISLRLDAAGAFILTPPPMRVTSVEVEVDEDLPESGGWPVTATVKLVDELAWLRAQFPKPLPAQSTVIPSTSTVGPIPYARPRWREQLAQIAYATGRTIASPTWWAADERPPQTSPPPPSFVTGLADGLFDWTDSAAVLLEKLLNSWQPVAETHAVCAGFNTTPSTLPAGYETCGPKGANWGLFIAGSSTPTFTEPLTSHRFYLVPTGRRSDQTKSLPLRFVVRGGLLTLGAIVTEHASHTMTAVNAGATSLPVKLRRAREHFVDAVRLDGQQDFRQSSSSGVTRRDYAFTWANPLSPEVQITRQVDTFLDLGDSADSYVPSGTPRTSNAIVPLLQNYWSDASMRTAWVYDDFELSAAAMDPTERALVLPKLAPRSPGETDGDGKLMRHVTIYRVDMDARPADQDQPPAGFLSRGRLTVSKGDIVYTLSLTPGQPQDSYFGVVAATPVTVGDVDGGTYQAQPCSTIDPKIRVGDLAYVDL